MKESGPTLTNAARGGPTRARATSVRAGAPGSDVRIRPIRPTDAAGLRAFYATLSDESRRTRFFGAASGIGRGQSVYFCLPDHAHREGFVAVRQGRIVGHVCVEPDAPSCVEVAVAVAEEVRGHGLGRRLVEAAIGWARREGYAEACATMLAGNPAIQRLLTGLGMPATTKATGAGTIEIRLDLQPRDRAAA